MVASSETQERGRRFPAAPGPEGNSAPKPDKLSSTSCGGLGQDRAFPQQVVAAARPRVQRRPWHGEYFPPQILSNAGGDQAAGPTRRLHHDDAEGQSGDQPVAAREVAGLRLVPGGAFGDHRAAFDDQALQVGVLGG